MITSHMEMPREGNLEAVLHAFAFLHQKHNSSIVFDPTYPIINMNDFKECKWKDFYGYLNEAISPNALEEKGKKSDLRGYVDSDHAREKKTRRSFSLFFIFLNTALIQ